MPSTDPNRIRIGVRSESERISETDSHVLTDGRTEKSDTAVNQETAVDAGARIEDSAHELQRLLATEAAARLQIAAEARLAGRSVDSYIRAIYYEVAGNHEAACWCGRHGPGIKPKENAA